MAIQKLPEEVRSAVRSGIAISTTAQCVTELVMNSLDAGASSVVIHLDIPQFKLEVDDNGCGITLDNLYHVGIRYHTSKCRSMQDLQDNLKCNGYRGEALASLSECCGFLVIVTRPKHTGSDSTYLKAFTRGKAQKTIETSPRRKNPGTTVTVQDFMCNAPVRQKRIIPNVDIEEIRIQVEGIALSHPHVSFTIIDDCDKSIVRRISSTSSTLETFTQIYGLEISKYLCPIGPFSSGKLHINGFISTSSYHNKRLQFIFVNGRLVKGTKIHKLINMIMRKSDVLRGNGPWQELPMPDRMRDFLWVSPLKKKDKYCVFMVHITCPISEYDITLDPKKTLIEFSDWDTLFECMENVVKSFLKEHGLACIAPDQEIVNSQSSSDSPLSVINEMEQLEKEDALGQKLIHFRCPIETHGGKAVPSGNGILNMTTAIHSISAKRNISNTLISSKFQEQYHSKDEAVEKVSEYEIGNNTNEARSMNITDHTTKLDVATADKVKLITFPLLGEGNSTPVNCLNELQGTSHHFSLSASVQDSGNGSLGRFRKTFQKTQVTSLKTPDDIQKIVVKDPPPIIRRPAPLEHRVKDCTNNQKFMHTNFNKMTTAFSIPKASIHGKEEILPNQLKKFAFDKNIINITKNSITVSKKNIVSDDEVTSLRNTSSCDAVLSTATQTDYNYRDDGEQKCTEKIPSTSKAMLRPNLKNLNLRRRQFQEERSYHNKIKVCRYDGINKDSRSEMEAVDKTSSIEYRSNHHHYKSNELSKSCFVESGFKLQKQVQDKSVGVHTRGKNCVEGQPENNSADKPNFTNLNLRRKYCEDTMGCNSKTDMYNCGGLNEVTKERIHTKRTHYDSQQINHAPKSISLPKIRNESEKQNMEMKVLTSEDFICSLEMGKVLKESGLRNLVNANKEDTSARLSASLFQFEGRFHNHVDADDEPMSQNMPVLEPYYSSSFNDISEDSCNSPPSLLDDTNYPHHLDLEIRSELSAQSKPSVPQVCGKMPLNSCLAERNTEKCEESNHLVNSTHENIFENLKGHESFNLTNSKSDNLHLYLSTSDDNAVHHVKNAVKNHSLVPMYSDSEDEYDDATDEMQDEGLVLQKSESLLSFKNFNVNEILVNAETDIKSQRFPQNICFNMDDCTISDIESSSICNGHIAIDPNGGIEHEKTVLNGTCHDKKQSVQGDIANSQILCSPFILHGEPLEYLSPQKNEKMITSSGESGNRISPKISASKHDGVTKSPFFADLSEWDAALSDLCRELENSDKDETIDFQSQSVLGSNDDQNLHKIGLHKDVSCKQKEKRFEMFARPAFCPKGLSPVMPVDLPPHKKDRSELCHKLSSQEGNDLHSIIQESSMASDELSWIKWSNSYVNSSLKEFISGATTILENSGKHMLASLLAEREDKKLISETEILSARIENQSKSFVRVFNLIHPCTFSKEVLANLKMIGKLDCKFIVAKVSLGNEKFSNAIVLFDQHAVHERIRLERLTQEYQIRDNIACDNTKGYVRYKSAPAAPTFEIVLNTSEARLLESFHEHFERLGLVFDVHSGNENGSGDVIIRINEIPACLSSKELKESGPLGLKEQVHSLIREQVEHLLVTRGIGLFSPNTLRDAINMKACRGAVKFGDSLSDQECRWLLRKLSACDTPFQCAHGRPSMHPIIELKQLNRFYSQNEEDRKPRLWRLKRMMEYAASHQKKIETNI